MTVSLEQSMMHTRNPVLGYSPVNSEAANVERRLTAILAADVVGYSRLMGEDEAATLSALKAHRAELLDLKITEHHGRIVKLTGDGILVEFPSVVNAVACAADIQRKMRERNAGIAEERRVEFRIGVNLGDVIVEGDDLFGDGVNLAARLEAIAPPGGIAISATVRDHVGKRLDLAFEDLGEQALKNIRTPVRVYSVALEGPLPASALSNTALSASAATGKPSIAVLPFTNMSGDPEQEYFSDGITEDIITDLSKVSGLSVTARNSAFTYKGQHADIREVGRRFNVATVLEGSVRRVGSRVRINAQLVSASSVDHIWADRYDRELTDIFAIQDEITKTIVEQLKVRLLPQERRAIETPPTQSIDAYNCYLQGRSFYHLHTTQHVLIARRMFLKAVELDPAYARAYAGLADAGSFLYAVHHPDVTIEEILMAGSRALELDPSLAEAHAAYALGSLRAGRVQDSIDGFERAIALDPKLFEAYYHYTEALHERGDWEKAASCYHRALEISPDDYRCLLMLSQMYRSLERRGEAEAAARTGIASAERALAAHPDVPLAATLGAGALAFLGERERAIAWTARALTIDPDGALTQYNAACNYAILGETEKALGLLERWIAKAHPSTKTWIVRDTDFDGIRNHPRFQVLLAQASQATAGTRFADDR
jgi:adenylate cyclase